MTVSDTYDDIVSAIFRFRDLVTPEGGTVEQHEEIAKRGYVWWGWWNKGGEVLPFAALATLQKRVPLTVHLFDSGRLKLYKVQCLEFRWDRLLTPIPSPEKSKTPSYYRDASYFMWLKLSAPFEELEEGATREFLHDSSYLRVDELFENKTSNYGMFYGKRIFDLAELRQQDRTIWFARRYTDSDPINEVTLTSANKVVPSNFPSAFAVSKSAALLWLSDIHCGPHFAYQDDKRDTGPGTLPNKIRLALERTLGRSTYGGIIVSGDLTWTAETDEFTRAAKILWELSRVPSALEPYRTILCPGNHDVAFAEHPESKGESVVKAGDEPRKNFAKFYKEYFYVAPNEHMCSGRRYLLGGSVPVEVVALNTSFLEQTEGLFQGHGYVGSEQLESVEKHLSWTHESSQDTARPYRILVMHHHLVPTNYNQTAKVGYAYSTVIDAGRIVSFVIRNRIDLVLHGHMHERFLSLETRLDRAGKTHSFFVAGLGSTGLKPGEHSEGANMFGFLSFRSRSAPVLTYVNISPLSDDLQILKRYKLSVREWQSGGPVELDTSADEVTRPPN